MLAAMSSGDDSYVRTLLDQRAQRADIPPHPRFSTFSDRSDSPSLYSHFSNNYRNTPATAAARFPRLGDNDFYENSPTFPLSPKERLADPNASSLDLSEDTYSETSSRIADLEDDEQHSNHEEDSEPETRLSLMGPKMRVHSRAPWEEDESNSVSGSEQDDSGIDGMSIFGGRKSSLAVMRGLGFRSKSPAPRPSFESGATSRDKRSFETTSSSANNNPQSALQSVYFDVLNSNITNHMNSTQCFGSSFYIFDVTLTWTVAVYSHSPQAFRKPTSSCS